MAFSLSVITNAQGAVTERLAYDAWGKRRHVDGRRDTLKVLTAQSTQRGLRLPRAHGPDGGDQQWSVQQWEP